MSQAYDSYFVKEIAKFLQQNNVYPEKVIMNQRDYDQLVKDVNMWQRWKQEKEFNTLTEFHGVKIEIDPDITDWVIVAPEHN